MEEYRQKFIEIIRDESWLMGILKAAKNLGLPDWFIIGGAIRNTIWDYLHGYNKRTPLKDIDLVFFDPNDLTDKKEKEAEEILRKLMPHFNWEVVNQARIHILYKGFPKLESSSDSIRYFSERANCIGIRLEKDNSLTICAPYGFSDLMNLIVRPVPQTPSYEMVLDLYKKRTNLKNWLERWPKLKIEKR